MLAYYFLPWKIWLCIENLQHHNGRLGKHFFMENTIINSDWFSIKEPIFFSSSLFPFSFPLYVLFLLGLIPS